MKKFKTLKKLNNLVKKNPDRNCFSSDKSIHYR